MKFTFKKKYGLIIVLIILIFSAIVWLIYYFGVLKTVRLLPENNTTITLTSRQGDKLIAKADTVKTVKVRTGEYRVKYSAGDDYQELVEDISINHSVTLSTPRLSYSTAKLSSMLDSEELSIHEVVAANVKDFSFYQIANEALYERGEWYGAELVPNTWFDPAVPANYVPRPENPNNTLDILRIIAKKEGEQWSISAGPSLVFYIQDHQDIPKGVVRSVNKLGF